MSDMTLTELREHLLYEINSEPKSCKELADIIFECSLPRYVALVSNALTANKWWEKQGIARVRFRSRYLYSLTLFKKEEMNADNRSH